MSDIHEEPGENEILHSDVREDQDEFQALVEEKDDYQEAVDAHQRGEEPDEDRPNASMP